MTTILYFRLQNNMPAATKLAANKPKPMRHLLFLRQWRYNVCAFLLLGRRGSLPLVTEQTEKCEMCIMVMLQINIYAVARDRLSRRRSHALYDKGFQGVPMAFLVCKRSIQHANAPVCASQLRWNAIFPSRNRPAHAVCS